MLAYFRDGPEGWLMRWATITPTLCLLLCLLLVGCARPVLIAALPNAPLPARPMGEYEPSGDWPDFRKVKELHYEPHWL